MYCKKLHVTNNMYSYREVECQENEGKTIVRTFCGFPENYARFVHLAALYIVDPE
jgi:hypothetical protein